MKKAGVKLPLMQRAWLMTKDHPGSTATRIAQLLKAKPADVSSTMSQLRRRQMVEVKEETIRTRIGVNMGNRVMLTYTVPARMKEYEILPLVIAPKHKVKLVPGKPAKAEPPAPSPAPAAAPAPAPDAFINALRQGHTPMPLPVQMLEKPITREVPQGVTITLPLRVPTREEIDRWAIADARKVYDYLKQYFTP